ncbi:MAG: hypothetical protein AAGB22_02680 [Bacteroidota bacterium]
MPLVSVFLLRTQAVRAQEEVYFPHFEVVGLADDHRLSLTLLFRHYVHEAEGFRLVLPPEPDATIASRAQVRERAQQQQIPHYLQGRVSRMGDLMLVTMALYNTATDSLEWESLLKGTTEEDLDPMMQQLARQLSRQRSGQSEADIYSVTRHESEELQKIQANYNWGLTIGGAATNMNNVSNRISSGAELLLSYDARTIIADLRAGLYSGDVDFRHITINVLYPFGPKRHVPFVQAGLGLSHHNVEYDYSNVDFSNGSYPDFGPYEGSGLMLSAGGGYLVNRHSNISLRAGVRGYVALYELGKREAPVGILFNLTLSIQRRRSRRSLLDPIYY